MSVRIPTEIEVTPYVFKVVVSDDAINKHAYETSAISWGMMQPDSQTITVRADLTPAHARTNLIHEIFHAIWWAQGIAGLAGKDSNEEDFIGMLDGPWLDVLRRNPDLVEFLVGG